MLKLLEKTHRNAVDVIYIDPPYNTGNKDFIYNDVFVDKTDGYAHSKWLSFMHKRLEIAKNLLSKSGVIFISIDDNEQAQLKLLCDEILGEENFVANIIWEKKFSPQNDAKWLSDNHDFVVIYAKNKSLWKPNLLPRTEEMDSRYFNPDDDPRGAWTSSDLTVRTYNANFDYPITAPSGKIITPTSGRCWQVSKEKFEKLVLDNRIWFGEKGNNVPRLKRFLSEVKQGTTPTTIWKHSEVGHTQEGSQELKKIFNGSGVFTSPKPTKLIKRCLQLATHSNSIILDFFAGSGTTGHAVAQLNKEDGGNRRYILCTNNENEICEKVTYQRLKNIQDDLPHNLKYLKTEFVEKFSEDRGLSEQLSDYLQPLIELQWGVEIDDISLILIQTEDDLAKKLTESTACKATIFISPYLFLSAAQNALIAEKQLKVIEIPAYYFKHELIAGGEL